MRSKGMSQTLALIVAASVLMMTAMTVIFMVQGGLGDVNQGLSTSSCTGTVQSLCAGTQGSINTPGACVEDEQPVPGAPSYVEAGKISCSEVP